MVSTCSNHSGTSKIVTAVAAKTRSIGGPLGPRRVPAWAWATTATKAALTTAMTMNCQSPSVMAL